MPFNEPIQSEVQRAESIAELFAKAKAAARQSDLHGRKSLELRRECGEILIRAKAACPHGEWLNVLKEHWPKLSPRTATEWMKLADPTKSADTADITDVPSEGPTPAADDCEEPAGTPDPSTNQPAYDASLSSAQSSTTEPEPELPTHVGWQPPAYYADLAESAVKDLRRFRQKMSAIFEGPCGQAVRRDYFAVCGPHWGRSGETVEEGTTHGVRVMSYVHECDHLNDLIRQAASLAMWLRRPDTQRFLPPPGDAA